VASQREKARVALGNAPASPAPNRNRMTMNEVVFQAETVNIVNADHHNTMERHARASDPPASRLNLRELNLGKSTENQPWSACRMRIPWQ
jgi:hypothetical protein